MKLRAEGIENATGKQKIIVELYDKFFRNAFPKMTERLGIVYTPVEIVDFIIHSVNHILQDRIRRRRSAARASISSIRSSARARSSPGCCRAA